MTILLDERIKQRQSALAAADERGISRSTVAEYRRLRAQSSFPGRSGPSHVRTPSTPDSLLEKLSGRRDRRTALRVAHAELPDASSRLESITKGLSAHQHLALEAIADELDGTDTAIEEEMTSVLDPIALKAGLLIPRPTWLRTAFDLHHLPDLVQVYGAARRELVLGAAAKIVAIRERIGITDPVFAVRQAGYTGPPNRLLKAAHDVFEVLREVGRPPDPSAVIGSHDFGDPSGDIQPDKPPIRAEDRDQSLPVRRNPGLDCGSPWSLD